MNAAAFFGASRQCRAHAEVLLRALDNQESSYELRRALLRSVLYHLDGAFVMYLRGLGESYAPGVGALIDIPRDLLAQLDKAGVNSPEAIEVVRLSNDPGSWLHSFREACRDLHNAGLPRPAAVFEKSDIKDQIQIEVYQDHGKERQQPTPERLWAWLKGLRELFDRQSVLMAEY